MTHRGHLLSRLAAYINLLTIESVQPGIAGLSDHSSKWPEQRFWRNID